MDDRMQIAAMAMAELIVNDDCNGITPCDTALRAVGYADALLEALAESEAESEAETETATAQADEVGIWRQYVKPTNKKRALLRVAAGNMDYVDDAFYWMETPQGATFWRSVYKNEASAMSITRACDFARRVLEAMEADGE